MREINWRKLSSGQDVPGFSVRLAGMIFDIPDCTVGSIEWIEHFEKFWTGTIELYPKKLGKYRMFEVKIVIDSIKSIAFHSMLQEQGLAF